MGMLDSLHPGKIRERLKQRKSNKEFEITKGWLESGREKYGFQTTSIDNTSVVVRDHQGREVLFECTNTGTPISKYDSFIQQMQNKRASLPSVADLKSFIVVGRPRADVDAQAVTKSVNLPSEGISFDDLAKKHGMPRDEMFSMMLFALSQLYARYKARLRDSESNT